MWTKDDYVVIKLTEMNKTSLQELHKLLKTIPEVHSKTLKNLETYMSSLTAPHVSQINDMKQLHKVLIELIRDTPECWLMYMNPDGNLVPFACEEVKYTSPSRYNEEHVAIKLSCNLIKLEDGSRYDDEQLGQFKIKESQKNIRFYKDFEKGQGVIEILSSKSLFLPTQENIEDYKTQYLQCIKTQQQVGKLFTCESKGLIYPDDKKGYGRWGFLNDDERPAKLVIDTVDREEIEGNTVFSNINKEIELPLLPYVVTYNLTTYSYAITHIQNLVEYQFNEKIIDSLIIKDNKKKLLSKLIISNDADLSDLIVGKSGGIIILSHGKPGTGKTLTAEVYSELMRKPLYSIQSSQLGISVDDIEKNLRTVLYRANKWKAVLLIDEADCYVYQRGNDILQNCIVGTFLRLLEYYSGVLFLTSNRGDIIDDAIMSRVTASIPYDYPDKEDSMKIWKVQASHFDKTVDDKTIKQIMDTFESMSGRDIRNLMKILVKYSTNKKISFEIIEELEEFLPFLKRKIS